VADLAVGERLERSVVQAERGDILGAGGRALVTERPVLRFGIDKTQLAPEEVATSARRLAELLDVDVESFVSRAKAAGEKAFVEAIVLRTGDVTAQLRSGYRAIPGARALEDELPLAPTREFARALLGTVGPVTAEMVEESDGAYEPGDTAGLSGLERRYDEQLRGRAGLVVEAVDESGEQGQVLFETEPQDGQPLRTTLEVDTQLAAERTLEAVGPPSALVAIRPSTGDIVAAADGPGSEGYATGTVGQYAPGSTFKVVTSLALLRAGMAPGDTVSCPATVEVDGKQFKNYSDYPSAAQGRISLRTAIAQSCNTALIGERDRVSQAELVRAAASLGLGKDHDIGFPAYFGSVPEESTETGLAAALIGQGEVLASPMAMAAVAGSVAAGETVVPTLLASTDVSAAPQAPLTEAEAAQLRRLMAAVVDEGSGAFLADVPGQQVLAKTGTAEFGSATPLETHAWMIAAQGDLAVAVFVERGESGSRTAGPVLEEFLRAVGR
jgi:cell division protein FtsI/penicillin-binding protein 2